MYFGSKASLCRKDGPSLQLPVTWNCSPPWEDTRLGDCGLPCRGLRAPSDLPQDARTVTAEARFVLHSPLTTIN